MNWRYFGRNSRKQLHIAVVVHLIKHLNAVLLHESFVNEEAATGIPA